MELQDKTPVQRTWTFVGDASRRAASHP